MTTESRSAEERLRQRAVRRLKSQADFRTHLLMYVLVNTALVVIWAMTDATLFWPIFPILGWGIGLAAHAWDAYGNDRMTEERIEREMDRLRRQR